MKNRKKITLRFFLYLEIYLKSIILASTSPRRQELLHTMGIPLHCISPTFEESIEAVPKTERACEYFAKEKVLSVLSLVKNEYVDADLIVGFDTLIIANNDYLGKPSTIEEAQSFLIKLSNTSHIVETGIACYNRKTNQTITKISKNIVHVKALSLEEIHWYLNKNEWQDAAGAYKIQGNFQRFVSHIEGTQSSVMGLPLFDFCSILTEQGYEFS